MHLVWPHTAAALLPKQSLVPSVHAPHSELDLIRFRPIDRQYVVEGVREICLSIWQCQTVLMGAVKLRNLLPGEVGFSVMIPRGAAEPLALRLHHREEFSVVSLRKPGTHLVPFVP